MTNQESVAFLFTIANEIKRSCETPVILMTMKDYADNIFNSLVHMRKALLQHASPHLLTEIISSFHLEWLHAVRDVENFKKSVRDIPREVIFKSIEFTKECVNNRHKYFQKCTAHSQATMTAEETALFQSHIDNINEMQQTLNSVLNDKLNDLSSHADQVEFYHKVNDEIEELMNWLDNLNDNLAINFSKVVGLKFPILITNLTKTLYQIIEDAVASSDADTQDIIKEMQCKEQYLTHTIRVNTSDELETKLVIEKIKHLEDRIAKLRHQNSSAVMVLQHRALYLEERLQSLEDLKTSLYTLKNKHLEDIYAHHDKFMQRDKSIRIFDHLLPVLERCLLVEELIKLWNDAICGYNDGKSIISILSVADLKEVFKDELGTFTVDKYGRKLYTKEDDNLYQVNEHNQLVAVNDDDRHVYFYDECGRYYLNDRNQRVYTADDNASEYIINTEGKLLKLKDRPVDDVEYWYDHLGRYYNNEEGKRIYRDKQSSEEYEHDGLGNLVRIRSLEVHYQPCPLEPLVTEESKYLQRTVGDALRKCLAKVVSHQPPDPILYLANCLAKYRQNIEDRQKQLDNEIEMMAEREIHKEDLQEPVSSKLSVIEEESDDSNYFNCKTMTSEEF